MKRICDNLVIKYKMIDKEILREINIKNCTCYHLDNLVNADDLDVELIKLDAKSYEDICIYYIRYEVLYGVKPLWIIFH